jgi:23S rRNA (pseudouridine1915-N3)-methyltransferase
MKIRIISVGRTEDDYIRIGAERFLKRIRVYHPVEEIRVKGAGSGQSSDNNRILEREAERLLKHINPRDKVILLDRQGKGMTSEAFAVFLDRELVGGGRSATFVIGGAEGVALSLSQMTLPHEMSRLLLLEQIYRGFTILKGKRYHR